MINVLLWNEEDRKEYEEKRAQHIKESTNGFVIERVTKNPIDIALRFYHGFFCVGSCLLSNDGETLELTYREDEGKQVVLLNFIGIAEDQRQQGKGSKLLQLLIDIALFYEYDQIQLHTSDKFGMSEEVLKSFYKKFGFVEVNDNGKMKLNLKDR